MVNNCVNHNVHVRHTKLYIMQSEVSINHVETSLQRHYVGLWKKMRREGDVFFCNLKGWKDQLFSLGKLLRKMKGLKKMYFPPKKSGLDDLYDHLTETSNI